MEERPVFFNEESMRLEGLYARAAGPIGAVISHPHSLMGGDMRNPVLDALFRAFFAAGLSTLRFNFRGVGRSGGSFDEGEGEQQDVLAAIAFLESQGIRNILLAGYSFGAWVNAAVIARTDLLPAVFVAPPLRLFDFDLASLRGKVGLIIGGDYDEFCPIEDLEMAAAAISCRLDIIPQADHFFTGRGKDIAASVRAFVGGILETETDSA